MSITPEHERAGCSRERPLSATHRAVALVTVGLAVAAVVLLLVTSAQPAPTSCLASLLQEEPYRHVSVLAESSSQEETNRQGSVFAQSPIQEEVDRGGSVFARLQPQGGPYRGGSVFSEFYPQPEPILTPLYTFMPMPVTGTWQVTCGYHCGLHTAANNATFALDIVPVEGESVGRPVYSPVDGQISAVVDSATFFCQGEWRHGREGGSAISIDFRDATDALWRLRLIHLDPATISDDLRPDGEPVPLTAGAYLGNLAPLEGCSHLHMSLTRLENGREIPQPLVIEGNLLEDCDADTCWEGAQLPLEDH
jgi:hypothetical protein